MEADRDDGVEIVDAAVRFLRADGERITVGKRAVLQALASPGGHLTAEEVIAQVERISPGVHRATVYRALESFSVTGLVTHVHTGHGATVYHLSPLLTGQMHLHARCRICGRVVDLPDDLLDAAARRVAQESDFLLDPEHIALSGRCAACAAAGRTSS